MKFLDRDEVEKRRASLERRLVNKPRPVFYYDSHPENDYLGPSRAFVASLGPFHEATLLYFFSVRGDGWDETLLTDRLWTRFRNWRETHGEVRRLYDVPGQQFAENESNALVEAIAFALCLGWDAWLDVNLGRKLIVFSHDDRVELHRGCERMMLKRKLSRLSHWRIAGTY